MSLLTSIDLSKIPPPSLVETLDYEALLGMVKAELQTIAPDWDVEGLLESDPVSKLLEVMAYRELHLRQRINESAQGVMLATARGANLDNLAALVQVQRLILDAGDPGKGIDPIYESDDRLRARTQLAFEGFSTAGPEGAYIFHALSASAEVKDVAVYSNEPGVVEVCVLSTEGDGRADKALTDAVAAVLNADEVRPITDFVQVKSAEIVPYHIDATLVIFPGVGAGEVLASANAAVEAFLKEHSNLGEDITRAALISELYQSGVQNVVLHEPANDVLINRDQVASGAIRQIGATGHPTSLPENLARDITFENTASDPAKVTGEVIIQPADDEQDISHYRVYWGGNNAQKLPLGAQNYQFVEGELTLPHAEAINLALTSLNGKTLFVEDRDFEREDDGITISSLNAALDDQLVRVMYELPPVAELAKAGKAMRMELAETEKPAGATHLIVFTANEFGEMLYGVSVGL